MAKSGLPRRLVLPLPVADIERHADGRLLLLNLIEKEMKVAMTLTGAKTIGEISRESLVQNTDALRTFDVITAGNATVTPNPQGEGTVRQAS